MKIFAAITTCGILLATGYYLYSDEFHRGQRPDRPRDQVFELFDADNDQEISQEEIENAVSILKNRDADGNGVLTKDELPRPVRHGGRRGNGPGRSGDEERGRRPEWDDEPAASDLAVGTVIIRGGFETDQRDGGRPVGLIAAALGVETHVFRDAFSNVRPSSFGPPSSARAQANKTVLMDALGKYGVSNDRLDEVSNYYRYRPENGESWPHAVAKATAIIEDGVLKEIVVTDPGHGYLSVPDVSVIGFDDTRVKAELGFNTDFEQNGQVLNLSFMTATAN